MTVQEAITSAIEGGYKTHREDIQLYSGEVIGANVEKLLLDPKFWQALGKTMGWDSSIGFEFVPMDREKLDHSAGGMPEWLYRQWRMIFALASDKTIEEYFASL